MRIAIGEVWQEANVFSPTPTRRDHFDYVPRSELQAEFTDTESEIGGFLDVVAAKDADVEVVPVFSARAMPNGPVETEVFESFVEEFVDAVSEESLDGVLVSLHGSMITQEHDDPEGILLQRLREVVGDVPIGASLDHHANVTPKMAATADVLVAYRTCPHTDVRDTGRRTARLLLAAVRGDVEPSVSLVKAPMVNTTNALTTSGPLNTIFDEAAQLEADDPAVLAASFCPVHPYLDVPQLGHTGLVITDSEPELGEQLAARLARLSWDNREAYHEAYPSVEEAVDAVLANSGSLTVLSDRGDLTLGGAPGDSPVILQALLDREEARSVKGVIPIVDPDAVAELRAATSGRVSTTVGGRQTLAFEPATVDGEIIEIYDEPFRLGGTYYAGNIVDLGTRVVLKVADRDLWLILSEKPGMTTDPSYFQAHGLDPADMDVVVVKSASHFRPNFEPIAAEILTVDTPGACTIDLTRFDYRKARPLYPLDEPTPSFEALSK